MTVFITLADPVSTIGDTLVILTLVILGAWAVGGARATVFEPGCTAAISAVGDALT